MPVITILGAGVMGSAMTWPAADRGHEVRLAGTHLDDAIIDSIAAQGPHPRLAVRPPDTVKPFKHGDFAKALGSDTDLVILGVGSAGIPWAIDRLCETLRKPIPIMMITKGLSPEGGKIGTLPDIVQRALKRRLGFDIEIAAVGGPCIAGELAVRRQTGVVVASRRKDFAETLCAMLETDYYHPRPSADMAGVELCAAFKNFFAIAVGWATGQFEKSAPAAHKASNHNAASILFDQAIREMMILARHVGGDDASVWGMPGVGDLYVTCQAGRNSRLGRQLGLGLAYDEVKAGPMKGETIEGAELGVTLAPVIAKLIAAGKLDGGALPLTCALLTALTENKPLAFTWAELHRQHVHAR